MPVSERHDDERHRQPAERDPVRDDLMVVVDHRSGHERRREDAVDERPGTRPEAPCDRQRRASPSTARPPDSAARSRPPQLADTARAARQYESSGTLSHGAIGVRQLGQCEGGETIERPSGTRWITTFRNEPIKRPTTSAIGTQRTRRDLDRHLERFPSRIRPNDGASIYAIRARLAPSASGDPDECRLSLEIPAAEDRRREDQDHGRE